MDADEALEVADERRLASYRVAAVALAAEVRRLREGFEYGAYRQGYQDAMRESGSAVYNDAYAAGWQDAEAAMVAGQRRTEGSDT